MGKGAGTHHWSTWVETFYGAKVNISGGFDAKHTAATLRAFAKAHGLEVRTGRRKPRSCWSKKFQEEVT